MIDSVGSLLGKALADMGMEPTSPIRQLMDQWKVVVGERIAAQATPLALRGDELILAVPDAVWRQELSLLTPEIRDRLNLVLGRESVGKIRLVSQGRIDLEDSPFRPRYRKLVEPREPSAHPEPALPPDNAPALSAELETAFAGLAASRRKRLQSDRS